MSALEQGGIVLHGAFADLGAEVAPGLFERELRFLQDNEWAVSAEDVLWRRSKLGLHYTAEEREQVARWLQLNQPRQPQQQRANHN